MVIFNPPHDNVHDKQKLQYLVDFTFNFLTEVANGERYRPKQGLVLLVLQNPMRSALKEIEPHVDLLKNKIAELKTQQIYDHGLTGSQLAFKFAVIDHRFKSFFKSPTARLLKKLLDAVDVILDSIIQAAGVGGAVKEFKDAVSNSTLEY